MMLHLVPCINHLRSSNQDNLPYSCLFVIFSHTERKLTNTAINATINWWPYVNGNRSENIGSLWPTWIILIVQREADPMFHIQWLDFLSGLPQCGQSGARESPPTTHPAPHGESSYSMVRMMSWWRWRWWGWRSGWVLMTWLWPTVLLIHQCPCLS